MGFCGLQDPVHVLQPLSSGEGLEKSLERVVVAGIESHESLEIRAGHHDGCHQVIVLNRPNSHGPCRRLDRSYNDGNLIIDPQCAAQQGEPTPILHLHPLFHLRPFVSHEVYVLVESLPCILDKLSAAEGDGAAIAHPASLAAVTTVTYVEGAKLLEDELQYIAWKKREQLSRPHLSSDRLDRGGPLPWVSFQLIVRTGRRSRARTVWGQRIETGAAAAERGALVAALKALAAPDNAAPC